MSLVANEAKSVYDLQLLTDTIDNRNWYDCSPEIPTQISSVVMDMSTWKYLHFLS